MRAFGRVLRRRRVSREQAERQARENSRPVGNADVIHLRLVPPLTMSGDHEKARRLCGAPGAATEVESDATRTVRGGGAK